MSALLDTLPRYRRITAGDLDTVVAIEQSIYAHPWTPGNFADSLTAGYHCWIVECGGAIAGYTVVAIAAEEAHLLNLSIAAPLQRRGLGRELLCFVLKLARDYAARSILLEVRPSNDAARALYNAAGFVETGIRKGYYPAGAEREDAVVLRLELSDG
jgi:[ribosomal protein S18]-alanine N-acetyltransferase